MIIFHQNITFQIIQYAVENLINIIKNKNILKFE